MHSPSGLLDLHERAHRSLTGLLTHCRELSQEELDRELDGFGYPTIQLQFHHEIAAEKYWIGVLRDRMDVDEDAPHYPSIESLEAYREQVFSVTGMYLRASSAEDLTTARSMTTSSTSNRAEPKLVTVTEIDLESSRGTGPKSITDSDVPMIGIPVTRIVTGITISGWDGSLLRISTAPE